MTRVGPVPAPAPRSSRTEGRERNLRYVTSQTIRPILCLQQLQTNKPKTKYDKMFGRKNQTILSSHYGKLVEQDETPVPSGGDNGDDEDFFSLKRADHDLPTDLAEYSDLSKRKIRMMKSKKALAKAGPRGTKLVFDEDGRAHELYEFKDAKDVDVERDGTEFMRKEIGKMQRADADDKVAAKEKKREKKRKRKEREREEVSRTILLRFAELDCAISSEMMTGNTVVPPFLRLQTTTATFPQNWISRQRQKRVGLVSPPLRRRDLVEGANHPLLWRRKRNLCSSSCGGEDAGSISIRVHITGVVYSCTILPVIQHILHSPVKGSNCTMCNVVSQFANGFTFSA